MLFTSMVRIAPPATAVVAAIASSENVLSPTYPRREESPHTRAITPCTPKTSLTDRQLFHPRGAGDPSGSVDRKTADTVPASPLLLLRVTPVTMASVRDRAGIRFADQPLGEFPAIRRRCRSPSCPCGCPDSRELIAGAARSARGPRGLCAQLPLCARTWTPHHSLAPPDRIVQMWQIRPLSAGLAPARRLHPIPADGG